MGTAIATVDASGRTLRMTGVTVDITERKQAEERQLLLAQEVDHRAKNALTLVQSILRLTRAGDIDEYVEAVEGRIKALSRAHTILSHSRWQGADLGGLIDEEFAPYTCAGSDQVVIRGPKVFLDPNTAQALALALHELAANAAKYGALSSEDGRVELSMGLRGRQVDCDLGRAAARACDGRRRPALAPRLSWGSVERQLHGTVTFEWRPEGLRCVMSVPRPKPQNARRHSIGGARMPSEKKGPSDRNACAGRS